MLGAAGSRCVSLCPELAWSLASPRIQGQLPHPHCLPLGTQGFQAEGREAASISWTRRQPRGTVRQAGAWKLSTRLEIEYRPPEGRSGDS